MLRDFRLPRLWVAGWLGMLALVAIGSLMPSSGLPDVGFPGADKLQHGVGYAAMSAYAAMLFATRRARWTAAAGLLAFGIAIELAQGAFTVDRSPELADVFANAAGIAAGLLVARTRLALLLQRVDRHLTGAREQGGRAG